MKATCPNGCNSTFLTTAPVMQEWEVDENGEFMWVLDNCLEVSCKPEKGNIWTCFKCKANAIVEE